MVILQTLWDLVITLIEKMQGLWTYISSPFKLDLSFLKIPFLLPNGLVYTFSFSILDLLGVSITVLISLWVIKSLVPLG